MCTEQLPPGGYPIAVKYIISYKKNRKKKKKKNQDATNNATGLMDT
jgi:hypothetical protein